MPLGVASAVVGSSDDRVTGFLLFVSDEKNEVVIIQAESRKLSADSHTNTYMLSLQNDIPQSSKTHDFSCIIIISRMQIHSGQRDYWDSGFEMTHVN